MKELGTNWFLILAEFINFVYMDDSLKRLIASGLIGAAIGAVLSKDKEEGAVIGALLGAAFSATLMANEKAQKGGQPVLIAENNKLYIKKSNGEKIFLKELPTATKKWEQKFNLK